MYTDVHAGMRMKYERSFEKTGIVKRNDTWKKTRDFDTRNMVNLNNF